MNRTTFAFIVLIALAVSQTANAQTASVKADFQPIVDGAIIIAEAVLPADGFLVVRLPKNNKPFRGTVLAAVPLKAGAYKDLTVKLSPGAKADDTLAVILHTDDTTIGSYEFEVGKEADLPFFIGKRPVLEVFGIIEE